MTVPVVLVSGAGGGIGAATVRRFATAGWRVVAVDLDPQLLDRLEPAAVIARLPGDIRTADGCRELVRRAVAAGGRLDALVNAAGVWREGPVEACSEADFDAVVDVNLKGTFFLCSAAIPHLKATQGAIVNISSDAGHQGNLGAAAYCASKGGVTIFTKALALELAPHGVRANAVSPGDVDTPMLHFQAERYGGGDPRGYLAGLLAKYPQGARARFIRPEEIAELVLYLCSPAAAAITGADLAIDQGYSAGK
ncbi:MAG: SDR family oxidoreductase [Steroidobacteraceae bacterium]|nr:SDR family oxidoreductase [Steroidobacteraceae bacterium]